VNTEKILLANRWNSHIAELTMKPLAVEFAYLPVVSALSGFMFSAENC